MKNKDKMTFNEFIKRIEREKECCQKEFEDCKSNQDYYHMGHWTAIASCLDWILALTKKVEIDKEKCNNFSWDNVKIGDKCINDNYTGTVTRLIFNSDGYCCGMVVNFSDESYEWATVYQDNEYKLCNQIGGWINE